MTKKNKRLVFDPPLWFDPTSRDNGLNKRKSTLHNDASTQVTNFLENWLFKRRVLKTVLNIFICNNLKPLAMDLPYPLDHKLGKLAKITLHKDVSTQV